VITAPLSIVKSSYPFSNANPNRIMQSLVAMLAGWNVPFVCTERHELGEEIVASYLYRFVPGSPVPLARVERSRTIPKRR
jgi:hypothetical protein